MKKLIFAAAAAAASLMLLATGQPAHAADSLAKVRTTMAAHDAAEATQEANQAAAIAALTATNAAQDAQIKALQDSVAKISAVQAAQVAALPTTPATTVPATQPASPPVQVAVAAKSAQAVWNLQFRAAPVTTRALLDEVAQRHALPAGWAFDAPNKVLYITADSDESGWDLRGVRIYNQGAHKLTLRNSLLCAIDTLDYCIRNGDDGGTVASVLELYSSRVYGKNTKGLLSSWSTVNSSAKASFRAVDTDWIDADYRFLSAYNAEIARNFFGRVGVQTSPGAHIEALFAWNGWTISYSLIDATGSSAPGASGNMMAVAGRQVLTANIFRGSAAINAYVAMQGGPDVTWAMNDNIIEPGLSAANSPTGGYIAKNGGQAIPLGNVAWATAAPIDAAIAAAQ